MNSNSEAYKKMNELFGSDLTNSLFPELAIGEAIMGLSAISQTICNILVSKGIITKEEYLKWFSDEELNKMANLIAEQAKRGLGDDKK